ncbi:MAG TPA: bifunctional phosphopantothenoylcysteine decarboxylase/phosphopantothenate--cysteine ligase CoaBC [Gemmatimonadaceae bacterium]|nr:bifunctional phosphopantothenoylcysteine decarboxylase/phosphopantothenate--cysteine ligase CoaBC [Gemmatimonadaceae bacterium]
MRPYDGRRILLGVSGGIAAYKAGWLSRLLAHAGAEVDVVMTRAATEFVGPVTFEGLTGRDVHTDIFARGRALDHIRLARAAHAVVVAPATADFMARAAQGRADDLLAACLLATEAPVLIVPAMNDRMWAHPQTRANASRLREIGYRLLEPEEGMLAAGEGIGPGRMPEPETIFAHVGRLLERQDLAWRRVVVTAGATREPLDPVRFISNRSSGKMGVALAVAAWRRGADVTLVAGTLEIPLPVGSTVVRVETTDEMADAVAHALPGADALVMAAAPADFRPERMAEQKIKKSSSPESLSLAPTRDILAATIPCRRPGAVVVGFALETENLLANARQKLEGKALDLIVANSAMEEGSVFGADTNRVTIIGREGGAEELSLRPKSEVADAILDRVEALLRER